MYKVHHTLIRKKKKNKTLTCKTCLRSDRVQLGMKKPQRWYHRMGMHIHRVTKPEIFKVVYKASGISRKIKCD